MTQAPVDNNNNGMIAVVLQRALRVVVLKYENDNYIKAKHAQSY
jgi:hypothetical protein